MWNEEVSVNIFVQWRDWGEEPNIYLDIRKILFKN